jgi:ribosomal protein S20
MSGLELDRMLNAYKTAVEAEVDQWEQAHFRENEIRSRVKTAKKQYEDALREKLYRF